MRLPGSTEFKRVPPNCRYPAYVCPEPTEELSGLVVAIPWRNPVNRLVGLLNTSVGQKLVLAVSGLALVGFLLVHMLGNLTIFQGADVMNGYAAWLKGHPLLWAARCSLIGLFLIHITLAIRLALSNRKSRPIGYQHARINQETTVISRYIVLTGLLVLSFLIYHVLHFTVGVIQPDHALFIDSQGRHDVYKMVVQSFQVPIVAISYLAAMAILGLHLIHGLQSLFQTFGLFHETYTGLIRACCIALASLIVIGNASIPLSVWLGLISL